MKAEADEAAGGGTDVLKTWWTGLSKAEQTAIKPYMDAANGYKDRAAQADKEADERARDAEITAAEKAKKNG
jgi:TRAP-type C4-dicarboxylate transport system substrate-binding protein